MRKVVFLLPLAFTALLSSCVAVAVAAGAVVGVGAYEHLSGGWYKRTYENVSLSDCLQATMKANENLKFTHERKTEDALSYEVGSRRGDGTAVTIQGKEVTKTSVAIFVRVGTFGDEQVSHNVHEEIRKCLETMRK